MPLTPLEIQKQQFRTTWRGYDCQEVDNFLALLSKEYEEVFREKNLLQEKTTELTAANAFLRDKEEMLEKTLLFAEKVAQERVSNAEKEANIILKEAEVEAERLVEQAHQKVREIEAQLQDLRQQKTIFSQKVKSLVELHLRLLENEAETP